MENDLFPCSTFDFDNEMNSSGFLALQLHDSIGTMSFCYFAALAPEMPRERIRVDPEQRLGEFHRDETKPDCSVAGDLNLEKNPGIDDWCMVLGGSDKRYAVLERADGLCQYPGWFAW